MYIYTYIICTHIVSPSVYALVGKLVSKLDSDDLKFPSRALLAYNVVTGVGGRRGRMQQRDHYMHM